MEPYPNNDLSKKQPNGSYLTTDYFNNSLYGTFPYVYNPLDFKEGIKIGYYNATSINTPNTKGLTTALNGICLLTSSGSDLQYMSVIFFPQGDNKIIYYKQESNYTKVEWRVI